MQTIINLIGLGMIFAFLFILFTAAISKIDKISKDFAIGSKPWEEKD